MADLTVMTWNVQNLLPVGHEDGPATAGEYQAKLAALATIIDVVEPDVLALQEVGPAEILADLNDACAIDFDHRLVGTPDPRGIRVALMSPRRLSNRTDITGYPTGLLPVQSKDLVFDDPSTPGNEALSGTLGRGVLSATVRAGGQRLTVMVAHLKSKLITYGRQAGPGRRQPVCRQRRGGATPLRRLRPLAAHRRSNGRSRSPGSGSDRRRRSAR